MQHIAQVFIPSTAFVAAGFEGVSAMLRKRGGISVSSECFQVYKVPTSCGAAKRHKNAL